MEPVTVIGTATFKVASGEHRSLVLFSDDKILRVYSKTASEKVHEEMVKQATEQQLKIKNNNEDIRQDS